MTPSLLRELATANRVHVPVIEYRYKSFEEFLSLYDQVGRVVQKAADLEKITVNYLMRCAAEGTRYVELMISPDHSAANGIPYLDQFNAITAGIDAARGLSGIDAIIVATAVRHRGPEAAVLLVEEIARLAHPTVRGFGLTGDERRFDVHDFSGAFYVARLCGLGCTAHAGEWSDARSVLRTVDELGVTRIGHGLSVVDDRAIMEELAARDICFEICLSSNLRLGRCEAVAAHPVREMMDAGCKVTLATDDPAYFDTTPAREYSLAQTELRLTSAQLAEISAAAIDGAFCEEALKEQLRSALDECSA